MNIEEFSFFHTADLHWEGRAIEKCKASHQFISQSVDTLKPNVLVIAGDYWNSPQELAQDSAANPAIAAFRELADKVPIIMIKGNRAHDDYGSLEIFRTMQTAKSKYVTETIGTCFYNSQTGLIQNSDEVPPDAIFHCFSYPEKGYFLRGKENLSIDEANAAILDEISKIMLGFAAINNAYPEAAHILVFHANIKDAKISNGQTLVSQDIIIPMSVLKLSQCDYYAGGHIHVGQKLDDEGRAWYSGSTYHVNYGETEDKFFNRVHFAPNTRGGLALLVNSYLIPSTPLSFHECRYRSDTNSLVDKLNDEGYEMGRDWTNADLRVRFTVFENESILVTDDLIRDFYPGAKSYKIERIKIANQRIRTQEIAAVKRLRDKCAVWLRAKNKETTPLILELCDETEDKT